MASTSGPLQSPVKMVSFHGSQKTFTYATPDFDNIPTREAEQVLESLLYRQNAEAQRN